MSTRTLAYALVDVFAERALEGNMLAIFPDARGLTDEEMQALARETNLAETTFILPEDGPVQGVKVRIFTTEEELPFAGHPTLGTASWLYWNHPVLRGADSITLALKGGPVTVRFAAQDARPGIVGTMHQHDPVFGRTHAADDVARVLGLPLDAIDPAAPIQTVSTGMPLCIVPIRSVAAIGELAIPQAAARAWLAANDAKFFYCLAPADGADADFHARMQFYNGEDPATGSAAGCAISWLVRHGRVRSEQPAVIEQGVEIHRPSRIHVQATARGGSILDVLVGGRTIPVAQGTFFLP